MTKCKSCENFFKRFQCGATLLGECDCPKCQGYCKCNANAGFDKFWAAWPKSPRKGAKAACLARWKKGLYEHCADQILKHVEWQKTTDQWLKDNGAFVPAPLVYLNQMRWDGAEIPEPKKVVSIAQQYDERTRNAVPMPDYIRERLAQIRRGV